MKSFRTELRVTTSPSTIALDSRVVTQGSCFSDAMGQRMLDNKMTALVNPFGVIYNPVSVHRALEYAVYNEPPPEHTFTRNGDIFVNFDVHSDFSALDRPALTQRLREAIGGTHYFLSDADWLVLTYGTAWVYTRTETGEIVANCHKLPASFFEKSLLSVNEIVSSFGSFQERLYRINPRIRIILTVSPVRHLRDTLEGNSVSKAMLRIACDEIVREFTNVEYFPAFEIMMDDLRDYRFYSEDMLHPTAQAEDYIWQKFGERYFSEDLRNFINQWTPLKTALRHRPFHPQSPAHQQFLRETLKKLQGLGQQVDVSNEISYITQQLRDD